MQNAVMSSGIVWWDRITLKEVQNPEDKQKNRRTKQRRKQDNSQVCTGESRYHTNHVGCYHIKYYILLAAKQNCYSCYVYVKPTLDGCQLPISIILAVLMFINLRYTNGSTKKGTIHHYSS